LKGCVVFHAQNEICMNVAGRCQQGKYHYPKEPSFPPNAFAFFRFSQNSGIQFVLETDSHLPRWRAGSMGRHSCHGGITE
jgi:hypothetical protein